MTLANISAIIVGAVIEYDASPIPTIDRKRMNAQNESLGTNVEAKTAEIQIIKPTIIMFFRLYLEIFAIKNPSIEITCHQDSRTMGHKS
jgi:hypothetical protein